jgi:regulatory protein
LIKELQQRGWLSDERYTEQLIHARKSKFGSLRVAHELKEHGVADALIEEALEKLKDSELANARSVWQKKFGELPKHRESWAKQARFLQGRGFSFDIIKQVLNGDHDEME